MSWNSDLVSRQGLAMISTGAEILPMSWMMPAKRSPSIFSQERFISRAMATARLETRFWCPAM